MVPSIFVAALGHPRINRIYRLDNLGITWPKEEWQVRSVLSSNIPIRYSTTRSGEHLRSVYREQPVPNLILGPASTRVFSLGLLNPLAIEGRIIAAHIANPAASPPTAAP